MPLMEKRLINGYKKEIDAREKVIANNMLELGKDSERMLDSRIMMTNRKVDEARKKVNENAMSQVERIKDSLSRLIDSTEMELNGRINLLDEGL